MSEILRETDRCYTDQFGMVVDSFLNAFSSESLFPETSLDVVKDFGMHRIVLIENVLQLEIRRSQTITEVLCEYPSAICTTA